MYTKLSRWVLLAGALMCSGRAAVAQDPVRLPGVVVKAPIDKPGPRAMTGVVRDTFTTPLDSVEISIPDLKKRALTTGDGKFYFDKVAPGKYQVRARKIGYAPQVQSVTVNDSGGVGIFELLQLQRALPAMVVNAARGGISGIIGDTSYQAIPGAQVRLAGTGEVTDVDASGSFYFDVRPGQYYLTVSRKGYKDKVVSVRVPVDSGRHVSVFLEPAGESSTRRAFNISDYDTRLAWRKESESTVYAREDLIDMGIEWIGDAIQGGVTRIASAKPIQVDSKCRAILNGGPETVAIGTLTIDDVSTVEIYRSAGVSSPTMDRPPRRLVGKKGVADSRPKLPAGNTDRAISQNAAMNCATVYVWTR